MASQQQTDNSGGNSKSENTAYLEKLFDGVSPFVSKDKQIRKVGRGGITKLIQQAQKNLPEINGRYEEGNRLVAAHRPSDQIVLR